ncbi:hypothetical protein V5799_022168, partial [Amblyomma americanum]
MICLLSSHVAHTREHFCESGVYAVEIKNLSVRNVAVPFYGFISTLRRYKEV